MHHPPSLLLSFILLICVASPAFGADTWSRFRGPNGEGTASGVTLPAHWTDEHFAFSIDLPGMGHSSPIVFKDKLFITSSDPETAERVLLCYDALTGDKLWDRHFPSTAHRLHADNSYASNSPVVDDEHVYLAIVTPQQYRVMCFDHNGDDVWERELGSFTSMHGFGASPMLIDELLIVTSDQQEESFVAALEKDSGETRWMHRRDGGVAAYSTPALLVTEEGERQLIFHSDASGITALEPNSGDMLWQKKDAFPKRCVSSPLVAGGLVFGTCGQGGIGHEVLAVRPPNEHGGEPEVAYTISNAAPYVPTPISVDGLLFIWSDGGVVSCFDLASGQRHWQKRVGGNYHSSPVCVDGKIFCISKRGVMAVVAASKEFKLLAKNDLGERSQATPAIANGRMYVRTESTLHCIKEE